MSSDQQQQHDELERKNLEAQRSVLAGLQRGTAPNVKQNAADSGTSTSNNNDDEQQQQQQQQRQQQLYDPVVPTDFSREAVMFVRYAVDCLGVPVFDLPAEEVQKLWLDFCVEFNTGSLLTSDWYQAMAVSSDTESGNSNAKLRPIRMDATSWPQLDKTTRHDWGLKLSDAEKQKMAEAQRTSTQTAQAHWRTFFTAGGRPATFQ